MRTQQTQSHPQARKRAWPGTEVPTPRSPTPSPPGLWETSVLSKPPARGIRLQDRQQAASSTQVRRTKKVSRFPTHRFWLIYRSFPSRGFWSHCWYRSPGNGFDPWITQRCCGSGTGRLSLAHLLCTGSTATSHRSCEEWGWVMSGPEAPAPARGSPGEPKVTPTLGSPGRDCTAHPSGPPGPPPSCTSGNPRREPSRSGFLQPPWDSLLGLQRRGKKKKNN